MLRRIITNTLSLFPHKQPLRLRVIEDEIADISGPVSPLLKFKLMVAAPNKEEMPRYATGIMIPIPKGSLARQVFFGRPNSKHPLATVVKDDINLKCR